MEKEYIQLPALKRDLDPDVVKALWAFIQLPEEYQERQLQDVAYVKYEVFVEDQEQVVCLTTVMQMKHREKQ